MSIIFRSRTEILLPERVRGTCISKDAPGWPDYFHGTDLTDEEIKEIREGSPPSLVVEYVDGFGIMLRLQPKSRQEAEVEEFPSTALFELRLDDEAAGGLATALENLVRLIQKRRELAGRAPGNVERMARQ